MSDLEAIIKGVRLRLPAVDVQQNVKFLTADDDNLWWFTLPAISGDVQIESGTGSCPFWLETSAMKASTEALRLNTVDEVVEAICAFFNNQINNERS